MTQPQTPPGGGGYPENSSILALLPLFLVFWTYGNPSKSVHQKWQNEYLNNGEFHVRASRDGVRHSYLDSEQGTRVLQVHQI